MPIYEYRCLGCGLNVEKMQKVSDAPLAVCDDCGGKMEKQVSLSGFQFKGAGWYVTDYSNKSKDPSAGKAEKSEKPEKSENAEKTDKAEKSSAAESTAKTETASKPTNNVAASPKSEPAAKKD